jgi:hypothetical protein
MSIGYTPVTGDSFRSRLATRIAIKTNKTTGGYSLIWSNCPLPLCLPSHEPRALRDLEACTVKRTMTALCVRRAEGLLPNGRLDGLWTGVFVPGS